MELHLAKNYHGLKKSHFGYFYDSQYVGSIINLIGCSFWVPWQFIALWIIGYIFIIMVERGKNPNSQATHIS